MGQGWMEGRRESTEVTSYRCSDVQKPSPQASFSGPAAGSAAGFPVRWGACFASPEATSLVPWQLPAEKKHPPRRWPRGTQALCTPRWQCAWAAGPRGCNWTLACLFGQPGCWRANWGFFCTTTLDCFFNCRATCRRLDIKRRAEAWL